MLRRRGVPWHVAPEVVQETAARVVENEVPFTGPDDLYRWCSVVARRLARDWARKDRLDFPGDVPDTHGADTDETVERRLVLVEAISELSDSERVALSAALSGDRTGTKRERDRLSLQVHRVRKKLQTRLEGLAAAVGVRLRWRSWGEHIGPMAAAAVAVAAAGVPSLAPPEVVVVASAPSAVSTPYDEPRRLEAAPASAAPTGAQPSAMRPSQQPPAVQPRPARPPSVVIEARTDVAAVAAPENPGEHSLCFTNFPVLGTTCTHLPEVHR